MIFTGRFELFGREFHELIGIGLFGSGFISQSFSFSFFFQEFTAHCVDIERANIKYKILGRIHLKNSQKQESNFNCCFFNPRYDKCKCIPKQSAKHWGPFSSRESQATVGLGPVWGHRRIVQKIKQMWVQSAVWG